MLDVFFPVFRDRYMYTPLPNVAMVIPSRYTYVIILWHKGFEYIKHIFLNCDQDHFQGDVNLVLLALQCVHND